MLLIVGASYFATRDCFAQALSATTMTVDGVVRDSSGAVIRGAAVHLESGSFRVEAKTDEGGRFLFADVPQGAGTVAVSAEGFVTARQTWGEEEKNGEGKNAEKAEEGNRALHLEIVSSLLP